MKIKDIYSQPGHLIRRAHQIATAIFAEETRDFDLTAVQFAALLAVRDYPGIDATRLSELIYFDRSTIGNVLGRLEKRGFLTRKNSIQDRRAKHVYLTSKGRSVTRKVSTTAPRISSRIFEPLSPGERMQFMKLIAKLVATEQSGAAD